MAQTPPWAKRLEESLNECRKEISAIKKIQYATIKPCYYHQKFGSSADNCEEGLCSFYIDKIMNTTSSKKKELSTLSPIVNSILDYMRPYQFVSPIKSRKNTKDSKRKKKERSLEEDIVQIS